MYQPFVPEQAVNKFNREKMQLFFSAYTQQYATTLFRHGHLAAMSQISCSHLTFQCKHPVSTVSVAVCQPRGKHEVGKEELGLCQGRFGTSRTIIH